MRAKISSILLFLLSVLLVIGEQSFAGPCPMKPNGMYMVCHWAGQAILGVGVVVTVLSIFHIFSTNRAFKQGLDIGIIANSMLLIATPGHLIPLCKMSTMCCHTVMKPFTLVAGILMIVVACIDFFMQRKNLKKEGE